MLKPVDLTVLTFLVAADLGADWTQQAIASGLGISQSSVHRALVQLRRSGLMVADEPQVVPLRDLLVHAVRHVYPAQLGEPTRGLPTAWSADVLGVDSPRGGQALVWPLEGATGFGTRVLPLHGCVPEAARRSQPFYELMALIDVMRLGRVRDRAIAVRRLDALLVSRASGAAS